MKRSIIAVYDNVAKDLVGTMLTIEPRIANAIRGFQAVMEKGDNNISKFPNDFDLVSLGYVDDATGHLVTHEI